MSDELDYRGDGIALTLHEVGVNMGDHGETIIRSIEVGEDESVRALLERLIPPGRKWQRRKYENFVTLRFIEPAPEHEDRIGPTLEPF